MSKIQKKRFWLTCADDDFYIPACCLSSTPIALESDGGLPSEGGTWMDSDVLQGLLGITLERGEQVQLEITVRELPPEEEA